MKKKILIGTTHHTFTKDVLLVSKKYRLINFIHKHKYLNLISIKIYLIVYSLFNKNER